MNDFYYILGLNADCSFSEVQDAYRKLSKKFHPDLNQGDQYFESRFREIKEAYDTLSDPHKRSQYDLKLKQFKSGYSNQQINQQTVQTAAAASPHRRGPGVGMTIALIVLALILGDYIIKYLINTQKASLSTVYTPIIDTAAHIAPKRHKRKHHIKEKTAETAVAEDKVVKTVTPIQSAIYKPAQVKPAADKILPINAAVVKATLVKPPATATVTPPHLAKTPVKPDADNTNVNPGNTGDRDFLYVSYVKANQTGVVNMRDQDNYSANIIETIPANAKVFVLARGNTYYKVLYNNYTGYIPRWSLQTR